MGQNRSDMHGAVLGLKPPFIDKTKTRRRTLFEHHPAVLSTVHINKLYTVKGRAAADTEIVRINADDGSLLVERIAKASPVQPRAG